MQVAEIINMSTEDFINYLCSTYMVPIPESIETVEEWNEACVLMTRLSNSYAYLDGLYMYLKSAARNAKRAEQLAKKDKKDFTEEKYAYEDLRDKADFTERIASAVKQQYATISRIHKIREVNMEELHMSEK